MHFSRPRLKPLFRRFKEVADSPSIAKTKSRAIPLVLAFPPKTLDIPQAFTTTPEVASEATWTRNVLFYNPGGHHDHVYAMCHLSQASDNPPPYSKYPERDEDPNIPKNRGEDQKEKGRSENTWRDGHDSGEKGGEERDDKDNNNRDDGKDSPKRKVSKKTEVACKFCRARKLKCDGRRPSCAQCASRAMVCHYEPSVRRRGPGRKNKGGERPARRQRGRVQESEASMAMPSLTRPSSSAFQDLPPPSYQPPTPLPGPPMPQYNFDLGQIPPTPPRLITGPLPSIEDSSGARGQHRFHSDYLYSQPPYTRSARHQDYAQQRRSEQYHLPLPLITPQRSLQRSEQEHMYGGEYSQASTSGYSAQTGNIVYHGGQSAESQSLRYSAEERDNEGPSRQRLKRRRSSSPPEASAPSSSKRRRYEYDRDKDDYIR